MKSEKMLSDLKFNSFLDFNLLFEQWEKLSDQENPSTCLYQDYLTRMKDYPDLSKFPIEREDVLSDRNKLGFSLILSSLFPLSGQEENRILGLSKPFDYHPIYCTPAFKKEFLTPKGEVKIPYNLNEERIYFHKMLHVYALILDQLYGIKINEIYPLVFKVPSSEGFTRHYQIQINSQFVKVVPKVPIPEIKRKSEFCSSNKPNHYEVEKWMELLPLEMFEFHGFILMEAQDLTVAQSVATLNEAVLNQEQVSAESFMEIVEDSVKSLLGKPGIKVGLAVLQTINGRMVMTESRLAYSYLIKHLCGEGCENSYQAVLELLSTVEKPIFLNDLDVAREKLPLGVKLNEMGVKEIILYPLRHNGELVGVLEVCAFQEQTFDPLMLVTLDYLAPSLSLALNRQAEVLDQKIKSIIRKNFTAIHPVVEWKFDEIALDYVLEEEEGEHPEIKPIVFNDVYPLYAAVDVKNSSVERNNAIHDDFQVQLASAKKVLQKAKEVHFLPLLDRLIDQIEEFEKRINFMLVSDEEVKITDFFHYDLEPAFNYLKSNFEDLEEYVNSYFKALDPKLGVVSTNRKSFEQSLAKINQVIGNYLEKEETKVQQMFPHYFEKFKTDGIEYNIYIGQSLVKDQKYDPLYLKNLRLWQLQTLIETVHLVAHQKNELQHPLDVTQMILAHSTPISISFRLDERKFDVEGAYNIRYEIIKKRIDKALVKGTRERLNQPGKIAIVYSQEKEAREYLDFIKYLQNKDLLTKEVEELELEEMQGVYGMKAIRVTVKERTQENPEIFSKLIAERKEG